jgi:hypothetical protein
MKWVKNLLTEIRAGGAVGGLELSLNDARSCCRLIKRFGISDQAIIDTIRRAKADLYQDPESKELRDRLLSTNNPAIAAMCIVSLQNGDSSPRVAQESRQAQGMTIADDQENEDDQLPLLYCDDAIMREAPFESTVVHEVDDNDWCKRCGMWLCTAPAKPVDATLFHVFFEDAPEDDEGLRACHECGQWLRRSRYDDWIEKDEDEDEITFAETSVSTAQSRSDGVTKLSDDNQDEGADEDEKDDLPLRWCDEPMTPDARDEVVLVHELNDAGVSCERCGMGIDEIATTHADQLERYQLKKWQVPLTEEGKVDWDRVETYPCTAQNVSVIHRVTHAFSEEDEPDTDGLSTCTDCNSKVDRNGRRQFICTAPNIPATAVAVHVFREDDVEDEEGLRACRECGERLRRARYDVWIENDHDAGDDDECTEDDEEERFLCTAPNIPPVASVIHVFGGGEDEHGRRRCQRCNLMLRPKRIDTILGDFVYDMCEDVVDDEAEDNGSSATTNTDQTMSGEELAEPGCRSGFTIEELRFWGNMIRELKDERSRSMRRLWNSSGGRAAHWRRG